jgi:hypothetical protein
MKEEFLSLPKVDGEREGAIDGLDILRRVREEESAEDASGKPGEKEEKK